MNPVKTTSFWTRFWNWIVIKNAIKQANRMHKQTKKQYYVIKVFNRVRVYDRNRINGLIMAGVLSKQLSDAVTLRKYCIYYTPFATQKSE